MTELIVALDKPESLALIPKLNVFAGVKFFKLDATTLLDPVSFEQVLYHLKLRKCDIFLDLKLYNTRDSVARIAHEAFKAGARFLTVFADPVMLQAAMEAKSDERQKVIAVGRMTDGSGRPVDSYISTYDGVVCSMDWAHYYSNKLRVCPGIRPAGWPSNNHSNPVTPREARDAGVEYIVVGRPIYAAPDPIAAAKAIIEELRP